MPRTEVVGFQREWDRDFTVGVGVSALLHVAVAGLIVFLASRVTAPVPLESFSVELTDPSALGGRLAIGPLDRPIGRPRHVADASGGAPTGAPSTGEVAPAETVAPPKGIVPPKPVAPPRSVEAPKVGRPEDAEQPKPVELPKAAEPAKPKEPPRAPDVPKAARPAPPPPPKPAEPPKSVEAPKVVAPKPPAAPPKEAASSPVKEPDVRLPDVAKPPVAKPPEIPKPAETPKPSEPKATPLHEPAPKVQAARPLPALPGAAIQPPAKIEAKPIEPPKTDVQKPEPPKPQPESHQAVAPSPRALPAPIAATPVKPKPASPEPPIGVPDSARKIEKQVAAEPSSGIGEVKKPPPAVVASGGGGVANGGSPESAPPDDYAAAAERWRSRMAGGPGGMGAEPAEQHGTVGDGATEAGGGGTVVGFEFLSYRQRIFSTIKSNWANAVRQAGLVAAVRFEISPDGEVSNVRLVRTSGDKTYDQSVLRAVQRSSPLPPPPDRYRDDFHEVVIDFHSEEQGGREAG